MYTYNSVCLNVDMTSNWLLQIKSWDVRCMSLYMQELVYPYCAYPNTVYEYTSYYHTETSLNPPHAFHTVPAFHTLVLD